MSTPYNEEPQCAVQTSEAQSDEPSVHGSQLTSALVVDIQQSPSTSAMSNNVDSEPLQASPTGSNESAPTNTIYGSFSLGDSEFAMPVCAIQEVVNEPEQYSSVPLSPDYLLGLFNLRGCIVPVVSLSTIFNIQRSTSDDETGHMATDSRKVAILEYGELCLGLLLDATGEVFNSNEVETCLFQNHDQTIQDQVIAGVFKMDGGSRIIQLLNLAGILGLDGIPHSSNQGAVSKLARRRGKRNQSISFNVGDSCCALDIAAIKEIVNIGNIENTVLAGSLCLGAIDLRGNTIPIVNFSLLLGYGDAKVDDLQESDSHRVIIMKVGDNLFGLLVACIRNIVSYFDDELIPFPVLGNRKTDLFRGCVTRNEADVDTIVLDHGKVLSNDEIQTITKGHSKLFSDSGDSPCQEKRGSLDRKTLITFSLDNLYGLNINDVNEVIDYPDDLIKTPTMTRFISGMANIRGELVAIIDTRELYDLEKFSDNHQSKVLVFQNAGAKYGLMVDSVNSIVPFRESDAVDVPRIMFSSNNGAIEKDVEEAIMVGTGSSQQTICVLDLAAVSNRASFEHAA